ncbi:MAG: ABC transporter permease [Bacteroidia bacterium]|nr:ABC transporter permease [Bacteroidia bacterium]
MKAIYHFGRYLLLIRSFFRSPEKLKVYWEQFLVESMDIGVGSLTIVVLISTFLGAVTTIQTSYQLTSGLIPKSVIGAIVANTSLLELAPTITSLVLAGKVGSSIASHLGTMRVTEQIDALEVMGINSSAFLIMPKIMASLVTFPLLVIMAAFLQIGGGLTAGHLTGQVNATDFIQGAREYFDPFQVTFMLIKAVTFGFIISSISSYQGFYTAGGALEVGQSSTRSVVYSCIILLLSDYILAQVLL